MSLAKKSMITLAALLITTGFSAASFASALDINGIAGESSDVKFDCGIDCGGGSTQPVVVCIYVFVGYLCVSG
jgi:hypothetical protein